MTDPPEFRQWTDYARVGVPLLGSLAVLGLFWFWVSSLIGDPPRERAESATATVQIDAAGPVSTESGQTSESNPTLTTPPGASDAGGPTPSPTEGSQAPNQPDAAGQDQAGIDDSENNPSLLSVGSIALVESGEDDLRIREAPSIDAEIRTQASPGTELIIIGPGQEADGYIWVEVEEPLSGITGYVADEFLVPAD